MTAVPFNQVVQEPVANVFISEGRHCTFRELAPLAAMKSGVYYLYAQPVRGEALSYRLVIDQTRYSWPERHITGKQIRELAGVSDACGVWQSTDYSTDPRIEEDQRTDLLDLGGFSIARFFTGKLLTTQGAGPGEALPAEQPKSDESYALVGVGGPDGNPNN